MLATCPAWSDKTGMKLILTAGPIFGGLIFGALAASTPALAQERVLTVFGKDECPSNTICVRAPEKERFRIPKELRTKTDLSPTQRSWASRVSATLDEGKTGPSGCAAANSGSWVGCFGEEMRKAREENRAAKEAAVVPER